MTERSQRAAREMGLEPRAHSGTPRSQVRSKAQGKGVPMEGGIPRQTVGTAVQEGTRSLRSGSRPARAMTSFQFSWHPI
eukprot:12588039-Prorocentrum_lima.AAC.1